MNRPAALFPPKTRDPQTSQILADHKRRLATDTTACKDLSSSVASVCSVATFLPSICEIWVYPRINLFTNTTRQNY